MIQVVLYIFQKLSYYTRPIVKGVLRRFTRLCELQRICYGLPSGAPRTLAVEKSLSLSRSSVLRNFMNQIKIQNLRPELEKAVGAVLREKRINPEIHSQFPRSFAKCMEQIWTYKELIDCLEYLRKTPYDCDNDSHETKLMSLWSTLMPYEKLESRVTKQWQQIGFQGDDPKTDFRGMGILGLENLLYFSEEHTSIAQRILQRSLHPKHGYAFAIVGINITHLAFFLVQSGDAKTHVYNVLRSPSSSLRTFHQLYCYLFVEFDKFWINSKPSSIMDFSPIRDKFEAIIKKQLNNTRMCFKLSVAVDSV